MSQYVGLRAFNRGTKIRVLDALTNNVVYVDLKTNVDTMVDLDQEYNKINLSHHSAIGQWYQTASNSTITAVSGGSTVLSGSLTTLYTNVVQGNPSNIPPI